MSKKSSSSKNNSKNDIMWSMALRTSNSDGGGSASATDPPAGGSEPGAKSSSRSSSRRDLPPLFWYMETGDWEKATDRVGRHPREVKTWATLRTKSNTTETSTTKRLALHHACFKLRGAGAAPPPSARTCEDPFVEVCRFILMVIKLYPEAAQKRESRHGCLPLHLAAFASCVPRQNESDDDSSSTAQPQLAPPHAAAAASLSRPAAVSKRQSSDATTETTQTNMSAVHAEETYTGAMTDKAVRRIVNNTVNPNVSVSMRANTAVAAKREQMLVQVINSLLDAYPKAAKVDSEGGRLPLHTACAGRATPQVVTTLITAYSPAARQRNKDGFLPLHLAAHWGVSDIKVAVILLRTYPDATVGRNRWERTPLEEALCMAGENGRPHQAALVRALRKHPSWWTRPHADVLGGGGGSKKNSRKKQPYSPAIDVDESLPSNESSTMEEQIRLHQQRQYNKFGDEGFDEDDEEDEDDLFESFDMGKEVELSPPPPPASPGLMKRLSPRTLLGKTKKGGIEAEPDPLGVGVSLAHLIEKRKWNSVVARIQANPMEAEQSLQIMTRGGFLAGTGMSPLHYACERRPPLEVVKVLIEAFNHATQTRAMPGGCLPLHIACTWGGSHEVVKALLAADSGSVRVKDELGNVALHSACFSGADIRVIEALLAADGKSVLARNHQGSRPIDICKRLRHDNRRAVMDMLTRKKEAIMRAHRRSRSSGLLSEIATEAEEMNRRQGTPPAASANQTGFRDVDDLQEQAVGVEVTYDGQDDSEQLLWI